MPEGLLFCPGIRLRLIRQTCQIIHTGVQRQRDALALAERQSSRSVLDFGVITLVYPSQKLHLQLGQTLCVAQFLQSARTITMNDKELLSVEEQLCAQAIAWDVLRKAKGDELHDLAQQVDSDAAAPTVPRRTAGKSGR